MFPYLNKILFIIDYKYINIVVISFLFLIVSLLEVITLAIIGPYLSILTNPEIFIEKLIAIFPNFPRSIEKETLIIFFGFLVIFVILIKSLLFISSQYFIDRFAWNEVIKIRTKLIDTYNKISYEKYIKKNSSEYIQNITAITAGFVKQTLIPLFHIISDLIMISFIIVFLIITDVVVFFSLFSLLILISFIFDRFFKSRLFLYGKRKNEGMLETLKGVKNSFDGYKETKILNKSSIFKKAILSGSRIVANIEIRQRIINLLPRSIIELIAVTMLVFFIFFYIVLQNFILIDIIPKLVIFFMAALKLGPAMSAINVNINNLRVGKYTLDKLFHELNIEIIENESINQENTSNDFSNFKSLSLNGLYYKYPDSNNFSIQDISFAIKKGEIIGITGETGSGKTTCIDLLLGLLIPRDGQIKINNILLNQYNVLNWHKKIAYLPQEIFIINDTVLKNITLRNDTEYDAEFLNEILLKANIKKFVEQMPNGINTMIEDRGINLSGGQRQRIALARSLYHNREILVMDEATSSLDTKTEKRIIDEIAMLKDNTTIIISHNINILKNCDKIIILKNGMIKEIGKFNQLFNE